MAAQTYTALQLIGAAMRAGNLIAAGEPLDPSEAADGLDILNQMLESWSAEKLLVFTNNRLVFNLTPGIGTYKMGQDGVAITDFNTPRPARINAFSVIILNNPAQPLELPMTYTTDDLVWQDVRVKNLTSTFPLFCYDDGSMPNRNLSMYPVPTVANQVAIYAWAALQAFADLVTKYTFPPGYARAIRLSLAEELAPEYDKQISPLVLVKAAKARQVIRSMNAPSMTRRADPLLLDAMPGTYNWLTDDAELD